MIEHLVNLCCYIILADKARLSIAKTYHSRIVWIDEKKEKAGRQQGFWYKLKNKRFEEILYTES
jgi:hypothetical protein